ncbi:MAG: hypothetical protein J3Q66DRAFT_15468 [Benniella sp.]|nr:MAG: hypothetical protein J3Q66DRAFT_15468 [Benniella sp.]
MVCVYVCSAIFFVTSVISESNAVTRKEERFGVRKCVPLINGPVEAWKCAWTSRRCMNGRMVFAKCSTGRSSWPNYCGKYEGRGISGVVQRVNPILIPRRPGL